MGHVTVDEGQGPCLTLSAKNPDYIVLTEFLLDSEKHVYTVHILRRLYFQRTGEHEWIRNLVLWKRLLGKFSKALPTCFPGSSTARPGELVLNCNLEDDFKGGGVASVSICD